MRRKRSKKKITIVVSLIALILTGIGLHFAYASEDLSDGARVEPKSELIYYIDVEYDGKDTDGIESSDTNTSNIRSGYINVEDKLPEGLTFNGFVTTESGGIGAVERNDNTKSCSGYVVDGVDGLNYNEETRTVSFKVKSLGAGCKLTVGVKTITPSVDNYDTEIVETRRDFYNTVNAQEGILSVNSNTVHAFMGEENKTLYTVIYEFEGDSPEGATLPTINSYMENQTVGLENDPIVEGYTFSGWTSSNVTITDGKFTMPASEVTLKGSFTKKSSYSVTYEIEGTIPEGYLIPDKKDYSSNSEVKVDSLKIGDVFNGYRFLGWTTSDITITSDNDFLMPEKSVTIKGSFEEIKYNVTYKFQGDILPPNSNNLLPQTKSYRPGEIVKLETITEQTGYRFLGWYKEDNFEMPAEDIVIYGEWGLQSGVFEPTITKEIINKKDSYKKGEVVNFKITITNNETFTIKDVILKELNMDAIYTENEAYKVLADRMVRIDEIKPNSSVEVFASYQIKDTDKELLSLKTQLIGAIADNNYYLNEDKEYVAESEIKVIESSSINVPNTLDDIIKYVGLLILGIGMLTTCVILYNKTRKVE